MRLADFANAKAEYFGNTSTPRIHLNRRDFELNRDQFEKKKKKGLN